MYLPRFEKARKIRKTARWSMKVTS